MATKNHLPWPIWIAATALSISPLFSKLAGVSWLFTLISAAWLAKKNDIPRDDRSSNAIKTWIAACAAATMIWLIQCWIWNEPLFKYNGNINTGLRLLLIGMASHVLAQRLATNKQESTRNFIGDILAIACISSFIALAWFGFERSKTPTHVINWSVVNAMLAYLLLAEALTDGIEGTRKTAWIMAATAGAMAVLLSQTRSAYIVFPMILWLLVSRAKRSINPRIIHAATILLTGLLATLVFLPSDPLQARKAFEEIQIANRTGNYNTSVGARVALYEIGWNAVIASPWIGIGASSRIERIQQAGNSSSPEEQARWTHARTLEHMHNQYLNNMVDGGLLSLSGLLILAAGLWLAAKRLHPLAPVASQQMNGLLLIHLTAGLSNVNFGHDYYSTMFGILVGCVFLLAQLHTSQKPVSRALS